MIETRLVIISDKSSILRGEGFASPPLKIKEWVRRNKMIKLRKAVNEDHKPLAVNPVDRGIFLRNNPRHHKIDDYLIGGKGSVEYMPYFILTYGIDKFAKEVNKLKYRDFLKTKYWQNVRILKRRSLNHPTGGKCEICGNTNHPQRNKNTHHLTYEHKGYEWIHLDDLMELCIICHRVIHNRQKSNLNVDLVLNYISKKQKTENEQKNTTKQADTTRLTHITKTDTAVVSNRHSCRSIS